MWHLPGLGIVLLLLLVVYVTDTGSHRWLKAGPLSLQPSELAKPALALFLAFFLCRRMGTINDKHTLGPIAISISVIALVCGDGRSRDCRGAGGDDDCRRLRGRVSTTVIWPFAPAWACCWASALLP